MKVERLDLGRSCYSRFHSRLDVVDLDVCTVARSREVPTHSDGLGWCGIDSVCFFVCLFVGTFEPVGGFFELICTSCPLARVRLLLTYSPPSFSPAHPTAFRPPPMFRGVWLKLISGGCLGT